MPTFETDINLGESYKDTATQFAGTATSVHFYRHGVERVTLSTLDKNGAVAEAAFDAPRLEPTNNGGLGFTSEGGK